MVRTRKSRGGRTKSKRGGNLLASVVGALKTALPSIVLYEALKAQGKKMGRGRKSRGRKSRGGGKKKKCRTQKRSKKRRKRRR
jgi:hypothetical protein